MKSVSSAAGLIDVFNAHGTTDVVIDLSGYYTATGTGSGFFPTIPTRICDSRPVGPGVASNICNDDNQGPLPSGFEAALSSFDPSATAFVVNLTMTNNAAAGYMTVFPDDSTFLPLAADITWAAHQTIGNLVVANLGTTATMDFFNGSAASVDFIIDVVGYYSTTAPPASASPEAAKAKAHSLVTPTKEKRVQKEIR